MVRNYKNKKEGHRWTEQDMTDAVDEVATGSRH